MPPIATHNVLIVGHSHVGCIHRAIKRFDVKNVAVVALHALKREKDFSSKDIESSVREASPFKAPSSICLCLGGNRHNALGIVENPTPFAVGAAESGSAPEDATERHFIPHHVMMDYFRAALPKAMFEKVFNSFPNAKRYCLNVPPPVADWNHIQENPGKFGEWLHLGPTPEQLRRQLYNIQSHVYEEIAAASGARFIDVPQEAVTEKGFLAREFWGNDPTHGNVDYGHLMLRKILDFVGEQQ